MHDKKDTWFLETHPLKSEHYSDLEIGTNLSDTPSGLSALWLTFHPSCITTIIQAVAQEDSGL